MQLFTTKIINKTYLLEVIVCQFFILQNFKIDGINPKKLKDNSIKTNTK